MNLYSYPDSPFQLELSLERIVKDLAKAAANTVSSEASQKRSLLEEIYKHPELTKGITDTTVIENNEGLIQKMLSEYFPPLLTLNEIKAVNIPYTNIFFNHTTRFQNILKDAGKGFDLTIRDFDEHQFYVRSCCIILNSYYGTNFDLGRPIFYDIPTKSGTIKHYRIMYNADFIEIMPTEKAIQLTGEDLQLLKDNYHDLDLWKEKFPLKSWTMKGFALMTLFDSTTENAVSVLKEKLLGLSIADFRDSIGHIFQSIYQIPDLQVGYTGYKIRKGSFVKEAFGHQMQSFILNDRQTTDAREILGDYIFNKLIIKNEIFSISDTERVIDNKNIAACFMDQEFKSLILAPIVKHGKVLGILEVVSTRGGELNSINAQKLEVVLPFLTDTIERLLFQLDNEIHAIVQENYTTIHPSVYWRFKDEAKLLIQNLQAGETYELPEIVFTDIYPLYAQVDIKDSSEIRNKSVQKDLDAQLAMMVKIMNKFSNLKPEIFSAAREQINVFATELKMPLKADTEQHIENYISEVIHPLFREQNSDKSLPLCTQYFSDCEEMKGDFYTNRRKYEKSIAVVNKTLSSTLDRMQEEAQALFPHYYERFKTDGVEHNLYIGPAITRDQRFSLSDLHYLRLWQLKALCEMERAHYNVKPLLPLPLDVRSLLLAFHSTIAIRFRMDEKRFDVDGSYNARYEIIKKRIDKAHIKNTSERITQTGKITIVYSGEAVEKEYLQHLKTLQSLNMVEKNIETHLVEDLPGVSGLKILRVKIIYKS